MADEIRVTREEGPAGAPPGAVRPTPAQPERQAPAAAGEQVPDYEDPERARADIEATRSRMSHTLDEIEDALVRKKEQVQDRFDVTAPVRENPWPSMGAALGAGLLVGLLTGGDDEDDGEPRYEYRGSRPSQDWDGADDPDWHRRTQVLEERTRRLLGIARDQEEEIRRLRGKRTRHRRESMGRRLKHRVEDEYDDLAHRASDLAHRTSDMAHEAGSRFDSVWHSVESGLSSLVADTLRDFVRRR